MKNQQKTAAIFILAATLSFVSRNNHDRIIMLLPIGVSETPGSSEAMLPTVTTTAIAGNLTCTVSIAGTAANGGDAVTDQGASAVTERGLCWNTSGRPTIDDFKASGGSGDNPRIVKDETNPAH